MLVEFHAAAVELWLAPVLKRGESLAATPWALTDVYPQGGGGVALDFDDGSRDGRRFQIELRLRDDDRPAARRTAKLDVLHASDPAQGWPEDTRAALVTGLASLEALLVEAEKGTVFKRIENATSMDHVRGTAALNLAIPADCGQACKFCSVRDRVSLPTVGEGEALMADSLSRDIVRAAAQGVRILRINGIEPLNAPYLFDLLAVARDVGFDEFHLLSTCRPLADRAFCQRFIDAMPGKYRVYVPIYGSTAALHDAITGAPGSFDDVIAAAQNLRELVVDGHGEVLFTTVLTRDNLADVVGMRALSRPYCRFWEVHLPFPNTSGRDDRFRNISPTMSDALKAVYRPGWWPLADLQLGEILPCIAWAHERRSGHALITPLRIRHRTMELAGTFYAGAGYAHSFGSERDSAFISATTTCPHADDCALASVCPQKVYALYQEVHSLDELVPIPLSAIDNFQEPEGVRALLKEAEG